MTIVTISAGREQNTVIRRAHPGCLQSIRNGDFWVSTGEILIKNYAVQGTGAKRTVAADVEYTYPLVFVEVVTGDGKKVETQVVRATDTGSHGTRRFPFRSTRPGRSGCGLPYGTRRATGPSRSHRGGERVLMGPASSSTQ